MGFYERGQLQAEGSHLMAQQVRKAIVYMPWHLPSDVVTAVKLPDMAETEGTISGDEVRSSLRKALFAK